MDETRRRVLQLGAGLAGVGVTSSLAGCTQLPFLGGGGSAFYRDWLYAPGTFAEDASHYRFSASRPANLAGDRNSFDLGFFETVASPVETAVEPMGIAYEDVSRFVSAADGTASVLTGSYDAATVVSELDGNGDWTRQRETDGGYTIFTNRTAQSGAGVGSEAIVFLNRLPGSDRGAVSISPPGEDAQQDARAISYGETVTGTIDEDDPEGRRGHYEPVTFTGSADDVVTVTMSAEGDAFLKLLDPDGAEVTGDHQSYQESGAQIDFYRLRQSGEYTIVATSLRSFATFPYTLQLDLVFSPSVFTEAIATIAATAEGDTARYETAVDAAATLFETLGGGDIVTGRTMAPPDSNQPRQGQLAGATAMGTTVSVGGDASDVTTVVVYEGPGAVDRGALDTWTGSADRWGPVDGVEVSTDGATATVTGEVATEDLGTVLPLGEN